MVASALLRNSVSIEEWLAATTFVKYCTLKKLFSAINYKEEIIFRNSYPMSVIATVCYFSVYQLIR